MAKLNAQIDEKETIIGQLNYGVQGENTENLIWYSEVSPDGVWSATRSSTLLPPTPVNIMGKTGEKGFSPIITVQTETPDTYILNIQTETDNFNTPNLQGQGGGGGTNNHASLYNLDFESAGHIGFASEESVNTAVTKAELAVTTAENALGITNNHIENTDIHLSQNDTELIANIPILTEITALNSNDILKLQLDIGNIGMILDDINGEVIT